VAAGTLRIINGEYFFMTISAEIEASIVRYFYVEKWRIGTIAAQLKIHHGIVRRVLAQQGIPKENLVPRKSMIDPFLPFVLETLDKFPKLSATRLHEMVRVRGYPGSANHFRHLIALYRPKPAAEAYLRLRTLPGEQAQVDWAHFSHIMIGKAKRPLMAFVMVLSFSRKIFLHFYLNQRIENFLRGHEAAFVAWNGVPRVILSDNLKSSVLERMGDAIRFNKTYLDFSAHYRFEPRPVAVARGNEKGRVERAIRYIRDNFFAGRTWIDVDDLNAQAACWCDGIAADRPCPEDTAMSIRKVFDEEKPKLHPLPDNTYSVDEREEVAVGKTPYIRFDGNDYSLPHTHVRRVLTVIATIDEIAIHDGVTVIARHHRCYDKGRQIEEESHIKELVETKRQSRQHRGQNRLAASIPSSLTLLNQAAEQGYSLRTITHALLQLLDNYGAAELEIAIIEALSKNIPHPNAVQITLEKRREEREQPPPVSLSLHNDKRIRELVIRPHDIKNYDQLYTTQENDDNE
jgi:transposase